eukprot:CAMPEP_0184860700 /NCGR_PEP_ID=MMETSP0580-20130426/5546_1 /TAXON_ID=1118495 /ORGANISM="Dactyliosolen fragilissimus" /LENGTH=949 /DNA_ID=CAMNT_0027357909 /DNA_START=83 /DNA_END=2932 /DNA_ORIENTATION=+
MRISSSAAAAFVAGSMLLSCNIDAFNVGETAIRMGRMPQSNVATFPFGVVVKEIKSFTGTNSRLFLEEESTNGAGEEIATTIATEIEINVATDEETKEEVSSTDDDDVEEEEVVEKEPLVLCEVPEASFEVTTDPNGGPSNKGPVSKLTVNLGFPGHPEPLVFETGKIGRQASGSITLTRGETLLYATASRDKEPKENLDFLPLSVEHQERFSSAGLTSGSYNKRDGRPAEHEILTCRLIDRPIRPLVADGWRHETQLLSWVLSYDGERSCDPLAISASAAALYLSDVPISKPVAAAMVGYVDGQFIMNPTNEQMEQSQLHLTVAGTKDAVLMIEGAADFLPEDVMIEAVQFGHKAIQIICEGIEELAKVAGKEKNYSTLATPPEGLHELVTSTFESKIEDLYKSSGDKEDFSHQTSQLYAQAWELLQTDYPDNKSDITASMKTLFSQKMFENAVANGTRTDGRKVDEVRPIDIQPSILPRVHGSALFTRGETQAIATATLGDRGMKQKIDKIDGLTEKRFYLQYTFPPSCVGETGRVGAPGRREIGHGNLAERALSAIVPDEKDFPYSIRVESLITESNGSSSMASVCGGCLALMDAGVPIKSPVAGIAMGMLLNDKKGTSDNDNAVILSDILGSEDALGTMDFKVAGNREGITTFQLDIKCEGLTIPTMARALQQAKIGRLHILDKMDAVLAEPRQELPPTIPRMNAFKIEESSIGKVIGPGGKQIRAIIEDFELSNMDVAEDGTIQMTSLNTQKLKEAETFVLELVKNSMGGGGRSRGDRAPRPQYQGPEPEVGKTYEGKITGIHQFGVFLEIMPGAEDGSYPGLEGLCHVKDLHVERVRNCEGFIKSMNVETLEVKYMGKNGQGKVELSRKALLEERRGGGGNTRGNNRGNNRPNFNGSSNNNNNARRQGGTAKNEEKEQDSEPSIMSEEEVDVIAQAIEGIKDL